MKTIMMMILTLCSISNQIMALEQKMAKNLEENLTEREKSESGAGNGGLAYESSHAILSLAQDELLGMISRMSHPDLDQNDLDLLFNVLSNIRKEVDGKPRYRDKKRLIFDYDKDNNRVIATEYFFKAYGAFPRPTKIRKFREYFFVRGRLFEEALHFLDLDNSQGRKLINEILVR